MSGTLLAASLVTLLLTAAVALATSRRPRAASAIAVAGSVVGGICAAVAAVPVLLGSGDVALEVPFRFAAQPVVLGVDSLTALFLAAIGFLAVPCSLFGLGYMRGHGSPAAAGASDAAATHRTACSAARAHAGFAVLVASLVLVVTARNGLVFLVAWEAMTVAAFLLVVQDHPSADVRSAGLRYLVASQLASACVLAFFATLGARAGSLGFAPMAAAGAGLATPVAVGLFVLAVLGFGTKSGLVPLHTWLPRAHPAAPSHVSAMMSGVLIKTGVYGLLRALQLLGPPRVEFGVALVVVGGASAIYGIAFAIGQRDLKRALAYSSIENVGLVCIGIGLSQMAAALGEPRIALLAATGALVHVLHHMLMKSGLFLAAGAVVHGAGTRDVEHLGGLLRRMPRTGIAFIACAAAISALPPFCGFVGEWLLLSAAIGAAQQFPVAAAVVAALAVLAIVLAGGLAAASFVRLVSVVFLGTPRSDAARVAHSGSALLTVPPLFLALCCVVPGLFPGTVVELVGRAAAGVAGPAAAGVTVETAAATIASVGLVGFVLVALVCGLVVLRRVVGGARPAASVPTWGCGHAGPAGRFQYSASSFGQPLVDALSGVLAPQRTTHPAVSTFPAEVRVEVRVPDRVEDRLVDRLFGWVAARMAVVRRFQDGRITRYLLFIVGTLVAALGWAVTSRWVLGS